jgi:hypothetical protein
MLHLTRLLPFLILAALPLFAQDQSTTSSQNIAQTTTETKPVVKQPTPTVLQADEGDR